MSRFRLLRSQAGDALASLLLVVLAILVYHWASDFPRGTGGALAPGFFPKILAVTVGLLAGLMALASLVVKTKSEALITSGNSSGDRGEVGTRRNYPLTVLVTALMLVYVSVLPWAGFIASTIPFLTVSIYALRRKHPLKIAFVSALFTVSIFLAFKMVLQVPLP